MKIGYERLFNMGNFEHEKFIVNKEAESIKEINDLVREVAKLEMEIQRFRKLKGMLTHLESRLNFQDNKPEEKKKLETEKQKVLKGIDAFKKKHNPKAVQCKCAFCTGEFEDDEYDYV